MLLYSVEMFGYLSRGLDPLDVGLQMVVHDNAGIDAHPVLCPCLEAGIVSMMRHFKQPTTPTGRSARPVKDAETLETGIDQAGEDLFNFAVDREDVKTLLAHLPEEAEIERGKVEYELAILRLITVGWSISYFFARSDHKTRLAEIYWEAVREFSQSVSVSAGLLAGKEIDYFQILKDRQMGYVEAMELKSDAPEPAAVIGPEFARLCGNGDDIHTAMAGTRMFIATLGSVKAYLEALKG
jgi:hypothetical protein